MKTVKVLIGEYHVLRSGQPNDCTREVEFEGERLAEHITYSGNDDTRGVTETLYKVADGRLVVHVEEWSKWQGEATYYKLYKAAPEDLQVGGRFEDLGREAGYGRPLTLDEALEEGE